MCVPVHVSGIIYQDGVHAGVEAAQADQGRYRHGDHQAHLERKLTRGNTGISVCPDKPDRADKRRRGSGM